MQPDKNGLSNRLPMRHYVKYGLLLLLWMTVLPAMAQEDYFEKLLTDTVKIENPVYKPVVGIGYGSFSFLGDVRNPAWTLLTPNPGFQVTVSTFMDKGHFFKLDFKLLAGSISANQGAVADHLNFYSDITSFGVGIHYSFAHLFRTTKPKVSPYVEVGVETFRFNAKGDLLDSSGNPYVYSSDGTLRNSLGQITTQDYVFESDLRKQNLYGLGNYSQLGFALPVGIGFEAFLSDRVVVRAGTSLHISNTDLIDNVSPESGLLSANKLPDMFTFSGISIHLDLFSEPEYVTVQNLFAEYENDETLTADEDNDWVLDFGDQCPASPPGVEVDSLGCPIDGDNDGVPDYLDKEMDTPAGHLVTDDGVLLPDSAFADTLNAMEAISREELKYYQFPEQTGLSEEAGKSVPLKFREFDINNDDYITFSELLGAIDKYFDYRTLLSLQDIYEFIEFYFSQ